MSEISFDWVWFGPLRDAFLWVWFGPLRDAFLDLNERDRLSLTQRILSISRDPWPDWVTKEWIEDDSPVGRLIL